MALEGNGKGVHFSASERGSVLPSRRAYSQPRGGSDRGPTRSSRLLEGVRVTIHRCHFSDKEVRALVHMVVTLDGRKKTLASIRNASEPEWNHTMEWLALSSKPVLHMEVFENTRDLLGFGDLDMRRVGHGTEGTLRNVVVPLMLTGKKEGWVELSVMASWKLAEARAGLLKFPSMLLTVQSARGSFKDGGGSPEPNLLVKGQTAPVGRDAFRTTVQNSTSAPKWHESFLLDITGEMALKLLVYDRHASGSEELLGEVDVPLEELDLHRGPGERAFPVCKAERLIGQLALQYVPRGYPNNQQARPDTASGASAPTTPRTPRLEPQELALQQLATQQQQTQQQLNEIKRLQQQLLQEASSPRASLAALYTSIVVTIHEARDLPSGGGVAGKFGNVEPYVRLSTTKNQVLTATKHGTSPKWNESFVFNTEGETRLKFEVRDNAPLHSPSLCEPVDMLIADLVAGGTGPHRIPLRKSGKEAGGLMVSVTPKGGSVAQPGPTPTGLPIRPARLPPPAHGMNRSRSTPDAIYRVQEDDAVYVESAPRPPPAVGPSSYPAAPSSRNRASQAEAYLVQSRRISLAESDRASPRSGSTAHPPPIPRSPTSLGPQYPTTPRSGQQMYRTASVFADTADVIGRFQFPYSQPVTASSPTSASRHLSYSMPQPGPYGPPTGGPHSPRVIY